MRNDETLRAVTAFAGARDGYQLPLALAEAGLLERLLTDLYFPADSRLFRATVGRVLPPGAVAARYREGLPSTRVEMVYKSLVTSSLMKFAPRLHLHQHTDRFLSERARRVAAETGAALLMNSYYAYYAFAEGPERPDHRILFQVHPHPVSVRRILMEEMGRVPAARESLMYENEVRLTEHELEPLVAEPRLATGWITASTYTAQTLVENGIPAERIHVISYGVDHSRFIARSAAPSPSRPLRVIFVGSMIQRKGLSDLLEAVRRVNSKQVELVLAGRGMIDEHLLREYPDVAVTRRIGLDRDGLVRELHSADVFALPSLVEGFGHVILEAMSVGLPVITTANTCAPDVIRHGIDGFVVPIRDPDAIAEKIAWCAEHRDDLAEMGRSAALRARTFTWPRFRESVRAAYLAMTRPHVPGTASSAPGSRIQGGS